MTNPLPNRIRELLWRENPTPAEEAEVKAWVKARAGNSEVVEAELERSLTRVLAALPDAPVPSNFTALVINSIKAGEAVGERRSQPAVAWLPGRLRWLARAVAVVVLGTGFLSYQHVQAARQREFVRSVSVMSDVATVPSPEILQDFNAIRMLNQTPPADEQLLAVLQSK
jgi:hypothetical protein